MEIADIRRTCVGDTDQAQIQRCVCTAECPTTDLIQNIVEIWCPGDAIDHTSRRQVQAGRRLTSLSVNDVASVSDTSFDGTLETTEREGHT